MLNSNGSGKCWIKYVEPNTIQIASENSVKVTVTPTTTTIANDLSTSGNTTITGDISAAGGFVKSYDFLSYRTLQGTTPVMSASMFMVSGTAATGNGLYQIFTKIPMRRAGSVIGLTLYTEDGIVKSGSLSGTILINGTPSAATLGMHTGSYGIATWSKDTYTFTAGQTISVQLTASATYLCEPDVTSASFLAIVDVEY